MGPMILFYVAALLVVNVAAQARQCSDYRTFTDKHTFCKPSNPACKILKSSVSQPDMKVILDEHNNYRNKLATGRENNFPSAANMREMVWDEELAAIAQKHASQCKFEHDCADCRRVARFKVGQNLAYEKTPKVYGITDADWKDTIKMWYDEIKDFRNNSVENFNPPWGAGIVLHFTQLDWADTWRIGCGYVLNDEPDNMYQKLYVCNYGPAGNNIGESMYKIGSPCSACPENTRCGGSSQYPGLCKS